MFEGQGMILKRGVQIGLGQMPRVTRLGKQTQVGQSQPLDQRGFFIQAVLRRAFANRRMHEKQAQDKNLGAQAVKK